MHFYALLPPDACYRHSSVQPALPHQRQLPVPIIPAALELKGGGWQNAVIGPVLQCMEAATLGMPLEASLLLASSC